jgi:pilus assembly protein CpaF
MAGFELPVSAIRRMIAGAVQVILQQDRLPDGRRVVSSIVEIARSPAGDIALRPVYLLTDSGGPATLAQADRA